MNKAIVVGNLTRDPEVRYTQTGKAVCKFTVAINRGNGENKQVDYIPVVTWDKLGETCGNNLAKGRKVLAEGRIQIRGYEGKDGIKRQATEIVAHNIEFLDNKKPGATSDSNNGAGNTGANQFGSEVYPDEEIPF